MPSIVWCGTLRPGAHLRGVAATFPSFHISFLTSAAASPAGRLRRRPAASAPRPSAVFLPLLPPLTAVGTFRLV
eukprot:5530209-Prymnesium_polylepis.1